MKRARRVGIQYAALPYQLRGGQPWILLISSRRTGRWVIPKGWPIGRLTPNQAAAAEALDEAGVLGPIADQPIGSYRYIKDDRDLVVQVLVFPLRVDGFAPAFKEKGQRIARWRPYRRAAGMVAESSLRRLILDFGDERSTNLIIQALRRYRTWRLRAASADGRF